MRPERWNGTRAARRWVDGAQHMPSHHVVLWCGLGRRAGRRVSSSTTQPNLAGPPASLPSSCQQPAQQLPPPLCTDRHAGQGRRQLAPQALRLQGAAGPRCAPLARGLLRDRCRPGPASQPTNTTRTPCPHPALCPPTPFAPIVVQTTRAWVRRAPPRWPRRRWTCRRRELAFKAGWTSVLPVWLSLSSPTRAACMRPRRME